MKKFKLSEIQAKAILDMRLQKLTGLERQKVEDEYKVTIKLIERLKAEGTAMLAIFHHPETTRRLADQVIVLTPPPAVEELLKEMI